MAAGLRVEQLREATGRVVHHVDRTARRLVYNLTSIYPHWGRRSPIYGLSPNDTYPNWYRPTDDLMKMNNDKGAHTAYEKSDFDERNTEMANRIADNEYVSIARITTYTRAPLVEKVRPLLLHAVLEEGNMYDPALIGTGQEAEKAIKKADIAARDIALRYSGDILQASGFGNVDLQEVLNRVDIEHIIPFAAEILGVEVPRNRENIIDGLSYKFKAGR